MSNLVNRMKKQIFISIFTLLSLISFSQKAAWEKLIVSDKSSIMKTPFLMVELDVNDLKRIRSKGIKPLRQIDERHFIFKDSDVEFENIKTWRVNNDWKLNVLEKSKEDHLFYIKTTSKLDSENSNNFSIIASYPASNVYLIRCDANALEFLKREEEVVYISNESYTPKVESRVIDMNINPNRVNKVHHFFPQIDGTNETVSIQEGRFDPFDIDLIGRYVESDLSSDTFDNHADEMATIVAGAGNSFVTGRGVASRAAITSSDFFPVLPDDDTDYISLDIKTQNHSYGTLIEQFYGAQANAFDESAVNNPSLLHVFSIGNQGLVVDNEGTYQGIEGFANITGNYKMSKNTISVGSVDTVGRELSFVSRGPAYDGRIKPEVVAYSNVGSSNSAALVSGISVLLQHQYRELYSSDMPSALVKALLINGAHDVGPLGVDFVTGYGNVNAFRSMKSLQSSQFFTGSIGQNEIDEIGLNLPSNALNLKITLVWTDPAANPNDAVALVNDLDMRLIDEAMNETLPWILNSSPNKAALSAMATRGRDHLNNVEQITVANPEDQYTIEIEGFSVGSPQDYYIVYEYEFAGSFEWDYPTGSDNMPFNGESGSYFRWNSTLDDVGELSYSLDGGVSWILLDDNVDTSIGYWRWSSIPELSSGAVARMSIGSEQFVTENFSISRPLKPRVGFNCGDSVMVKWPIIPNAESYTIFRLGEKVLEEIITTTDTALIINNKNAIIDQRLSIRPNLADKSLLRSPTFDYSLQGVDCYVMSFFQEISLDTGIYLNLDLGTSYGIEELVFYRLEGINRLKIDEIINPTKEDIRLLDSQPNQGYNEHIVHIRFQNGEEIEMSSGISSYVTEVPILIFPNVLFSGESLTILLKEFESQNPVLKVFDMKGSEVLIEANLSTQEFIPINLKAGIYIYRFEDGPVNSSGRLIVR